MHQFSTFTRILSPLFLSISLSLYPLSLSPPPQLSNIPQHKRRRLVLNHLVQLFGTQVCMLLINIFHSVLILLYRTKQNYTILYYPILSYPILSYPSYPILSYPILSYPTLSCTILSYPLLYYPSYTILSCLPYPILYYPICN